MLIDCSLSIHLPTCPSHLFQTYSPFAELCCVTCNVCLFAVFCVFRALCFVGLLVAFQQLLLPFALLMLFYAAFWIVATCCCYHHCHDWITVDVSANQSLCLIFTVDFVVALIGVFFGIILLL